MRLIDLADEKQKLEVDELWAQGLDQLFRMYWIRKLLAERK